VGIALGVRRFIPSHFPTLAGACGVTPELPLGPQPCKLLFFGHERKAKVATDMNPFLKMYKSLKEMFWEIEKLEATEELTLLQKSRSWY
jgi:hypothetical protein